MKTKKESVILSIILLCLVLIAVGMSYAFLKTSFFGNKTSVLKVGSLSLILDETSGNAITVEDGTPMYDSEGMKQDNYFIFSLKNNGTLDSSYTIYLENQPLDEGDTRVNSNYVRYNLEKDNSVLQPDSLEGDQAIDKGIIKKNQTINYKMRLWFASDIPQSEENKVFKAKLNVVGNQNTKMMASSLGLTNDEKNTVTKIVFQDSIKSIDNESKVWDTSVAKNKTVMARLVPNIDDTTTNTLYIQSDGIVFANYNSSGTFSNFLNLAAIENLSLLNTASTTDLSGLFNSCSNLVDLDLTVLDTSKVTNMSYMFNGCWKLQNLNISSFNTSKVTNMQLMFNNCSELVEINISGFDTANVVNMQLMFSNCKKVKNLNLSSFDTSKVTRIDGMFQNCSGLKNLDLSNFNTFNVTNMSYMFSNCKNLTSLDISRFNTLNVTNMCYMFGNCNSLINLDVSNFNTSKVTNMSGMFNDCSSLNCLNVSNFDTSKVTNMSNMFSGCSSLTSLDVSKFNTSMVISMAVMFGNCHNLELLYVSNFGTSNVTDMGKMFYGCKNLLSLDVSGFDTSNVTNMSGMFYGCKSLISLNMSKAEFTNVNSFDNMFFSVPLTIKIAVKDENAKNWLENILGEKGNIIIS